MFEVWGLGFRVEVFGVWCLGFGVWGLGFGVWGLGMGFGVCGFGVWVLGIGVEGGVDMQTFEQRRASYGIGIR